MSAESEACASGRPSPCQFSFFLQVLPFLRLGAQHISREEEQRPTEIQRPLTQRLGVQCRIEQCGSSKSASLGPVSHEDTQNTLQEQSLPLFTASLQIPRPPKSHLAGNQRRRRNLQAAVPESSV